MNNRINTPLLILPCAGGSAANYRGYTKYYKNVIIYEYPGHWAKIDEHLDESFDKMVECMVDSVYGQVDNDDIIVLGHSMGALVGYASIECFRKRHITVRGLYVAASYCPYSSVNTFNKIESDIDIYRFLKNISGISDKIIGSDFFKENMLPAIKNDFKILKMLKNSRYLDQQEAIPITGLYGEDDPLVSYIDIVKWKMYSSGTFKVARYKGNHFFVTADNNIREIIAEIK